MAELKSLTVELRLDAEGRALLDLLRGLKGGGRLVTPDLVSQLVRDRDEWKEKHDNLKGLLDSYKEQWKRHYEGQYTANLEQLRQQFSTAQDNLADDRVTASLTAMRNEIVARWGQPADLTPLLVFVDDLIKQGGVPLKGKYP